jgi:hypothetical protein
VACRVVRWRSRRRWRRPGSRGAVRVPLSGARTEGLIEGVEYFLVAGSVGEVVAFVEVADDAALVHHHDRRYRHTLLVVPQVAASGEFTPGVAEERER